MFNMFQSMNTGCLLLCHLFRFLKISIIIFKFYQENSLHILLDLYLSFHFQWSNCKCFTHTHNQYIEVDWLVCWSGNMHSCLTHLLVQGGWYLFVFSFCRFIRIICIDNYSSIHKDGCISPFSMCMPFFVLCFIIF